MDWLLKHNLIKQYLQKNFKQKEFKRAIKYTLIIGIQTLYQLHGNSSTDPYISFTLEQLSSMIVSNNGTLNIQSDLPALNKCLKDIKQQLGDIQNELDTKNINTTSNLDSNSQKFVKNIFKPKPKPKNTNKSKNIKPVKNNITTKKTKVIKKADSKWRIGDTKQFKPSDIYPNWWPEENTNNDTNESEEKSENTNEENEENNFEEKIDCNKYMPQEPQHPHIYNQPVAFSIPKSQFDKNEDNNNNIVQLHVNLYPEYMQKCLDLDLEEKNNLKLNEFEDRNKNKNVNNKKRHNSKVNKHDKNIRSKSLTQCTESSQAKANGNKTQSQYLKSDNRNIAPCLKHKKSKNTNYNNVNYVKKKNKKKSKKSSIKRPKYLDNVESRIKNELIKDRERNIYIQNEKELLMRDIAKYGLDEHKNDEYYEEWKEKFGYTRLSKDDISKPSAISVADAMMKSNIITAMNPSFNKQPILITENDAENNNSMNMNFLTDLREWATSLTTNELNISD